MEEERKNREREEWGRVIKILFFGNGYILCLYEIVNRNQKSKKNKAHIQSNHCQSKNTRN
jgi:hypothetical protein